MFYLINVSAVQEQKAIADHEGYGADPYPSNSQGFKHQLTLEV
ncbi:hypothetical protein [Trichocoleus sp. Lan]